MAVVACIAALMLGSGIGRGDEPGPLLRRLPSVEGATNPPLAVHRERNVVDAFDATTSPDSVDLGASPSAAHASTSAAFQGDSSEVGADLASRLEAVEAELAELRRAEQCEDESSDELPLAQFTAQLQVDYWELSQDRASYETFGNISEGIAFRRARVEWFGGYQQTEYRIGFDFALPGRPSFLDVFAGIEDLPLVNRLRVGHFFEPFSLERMTSNRFTTFMERSLVDTPFAPARNVGIIGNWWTDDERATWALGVFRANSNPFGDDQSDSDENAVTTRFTWLPRYDEPSDGRHYTHVGFGYSLRGFNNDQGRFYTQPEARLGADNPNIPNFVDTGYFPADTFQLYGAEFAWIQGAFSIQSEYMVVPVDRIGAPDATFNGGYVYVSYFLTGEHRPYRRRDGTFDRVIPYENFFRVSTCEGVRTGKGAWEVALRLSHIDLTDQGIEGGRLTDLTFGMNWYMTQCMRMDFNYVRAFLDNPTYGDSGTDLWGMRVGYEF